MTHRYCQNWLWAEPFCPFTRKPISCSKPWQMMLPKLLGGRKKKDRRPTDLKIPLPRIHGIHNADLTESQISALLRQPHQAAPTHFNKEHFARTNSHRILSQPDYLRVTRDANEPVVYAPKPGHPLPPARRLLRSEDHDKTQIESEHEAVDDTQSCESSYDDEDDDLLVESLNVKPGVPVRLDNKKPMRHPDSEKAVAGSAAATTMLSKPSPGRNLTTSPDDLDSIDLSPTPNVPGHYPKSMSVEKSAPLERASYMSEMSSNESQQTFATAPQSPFSHLSSVRSTPSMTILANTDLPSSLDPSDLLHHISQQRHSAPEARRADPTVIDPKTAKPEIVQPEMVENEVHPLRHQIESFPALLSPEQQLSPNPISPESPRRQSTGIVSSSVTSPASSVNTTKAVVSSAVTTPAQASLKRIASINSQPAANIPTIVHPVKPPSQNSNKHLESSNESNATATPGSRFAETTAEIEALRKQMVAIQQERAEWHKRENEHRARERQMLAQITRTQEQLQSALAQAGFYTGPRTSKNPTPISQSSGGAINTADLDSTSSGSLRLPRKKSGGSTSHSISRSHQARSRSNSRGRSTSHTDRSQYERDRRKDYHRPLEHSRSRSYDRGRSYDRRGNPVYEPRRYKQSSSSDDSEDNYRHHSRSRSRRRQTSRDSHNRRRYYHDDDYSDSDYEVRGRRRRYARSLDPPSRGISRSRSGNLAADQQYSYHSAVEDEEQARSRFPTSHRREVHRSRSRADEPRSKPDLRSHPSKHPQQPKGTDPSALASQSTVKQPTTTMSRADPSPVVTPKSILRNASNGILSRQSSAGSTVRKMNNGRIMKENVLAN
ncbi:hypothetical protein K450DRAFT_252706 [Umbelopsis ramanniana AG]|uniref:Uncharacterized protein n=1 Tax=Umbelopsis ramanniana AG TaxID=1314678 RepID=A0AAD5E4P3_UMBRA|nr:uncharacterized protein K450DRAFT_252706 [Umbelopsis ramanniana AG]KAI8577341.1 hypothetical protein K450DRAFT_252706 [Umbelopsis ramanniana AG]